MRMSTRDAPICVIRDEICALLAHGVSTIIRVSHAIALAPTMRENTAISTVSMTEREREPVSLCVCVVMASAAPFCFNYKLCLFACG